MKPNLLKIIGAGLTSLACALPGCATLNQTPNQSQQSQVQPPLTQSYSTPSLPSPMESDNYQYTQSAQPNKKENPVTASAYVAQSFGDVVLGSGYHTGPFPSMLTDAGVTIENNNTSLTAWTWSVFGDTGKNHEHDHGLTGKLKLNENFTLTGSIEDWSYGQHSSIGTLGLGYNNNGFGTKFNSLTDLNDGGTLYVLTLSQKLEEKHNLKAEVKTAYSDNFLGGNVPDGFLHITPSISANLGKIGPLNFSGTLGYQAELHKSRDSFVFGYITAEFSTPKVRLNGEK